jgi:hypothetical protein
MIAVLSADERLFCASGMLDGEVGGCLAASVWEKTALPLSMYRKRRRNTALIPHKATQDQPQNTVGHDSAVCGQQVSHPETVHSQIPLYAGSSQEGA